MPYFPLYNSRNTAESATSIAPLKLFLGLSMCDRIAHGIMGSLDGKLILKSVLSHGCMQPNKPDMKVTG